MNTVRFWRRERQISQHHLSMETGIPRHRLSLIEQQYVDPTTGEIERIAKTLGVDKPKLVKHDDDEPRQLEMDFETGEVK